MINDGYIAQMLAGTSVAAVGLAISATSPASLTVNIGPGAITGFTEVDPNAYGDLGTNTDPLLKVGINLTSTPFTLTAPATSGQSINYLIEALFEEQDIDPIVFPYVNPSNPAVPFSGPSNTGATQNSIRAQIASLQLLAGAAANTGTQTTPATTAGWSPLYVITVNNGQTTVTSSSWSVSPGAPFIGGGSVSVGRLLNIHTFTSSGTYTPTPGTNSIVVEVLGGGGAGGGSANTGASQCSAGGGGGAGGYSRKRLTSGFTGVAVTVGAGGAAAAQAVGGSGGTSTFASSTAVVGNGGSGGSLGPVESDSAAFPFGGAQGGTSNGGDINGVGGLGQYAFYASTNSSSGNGGSSYFGSGAQGTTGAGNGHAAVTPGSGGSGGVQGTPSSAGATGGAGAAGVIIVREYS
jgi:hypothetical protein